MTTKDLRRTIRVALAARNLTLKQVAARAEIRYDRAHAVVTGRRPARAGELARIVNAIVGLAEREP